MVLSYFPFTFIYSLIFRYYLYGKDLLVLIGNSLHDLSLIIFLTASLGYSSSFSPKNHTASKHQTLGNPSCCLSPRQNSGVITDSPLPAVDTHHFLPALPS